MGVITHQEKKKNWIKTILSLTLKGWCICLNVSFFLATCLNVSFIFVIYILKEKKKKKKNLTILSCDSTFFNIYTKIQITNYKTHNEAIQITHIMKCTMKLVKYKMLVKIVAKCHSSYFGSIRVQYSLVTLCHFDEANLTLVIFYKIHWILIIILPKLKE